MIYLFIAVIIAGFSQVLLKKSADKSYDSFVKEYLNRYVIIGYIMMVVSTIAIIMGYRIVEYKNGPVIESLGYILIMVLSYYFFSEKITKRKLLGNGLILFGIFIFYV